ncbi:MAG TPA: hypothetical protein VD768_05155 [Sphingomicrobium sp.]|nr:hypothetical protein [Sphingomicrobium sp.]
MRITLLALPLMFAATPALAQQAAAPPIAIPPQLSDPATADRLAGAMQALSRVFLNLPVGEVQAALEGRQATAAEKRMTVRDIGRRDDPNFDRNLEQQIAATGPMVRQSVKVLVDALPSMMQAMGSVRQSMERATANLPQPGYPRR